MSRTRILVVEDEPVVARYLQCALEQLGYEVSGIAASGEAAIRSAVESRPALVLMDIGLDGTIDGIQAAGELRALHDLPVVYLSANADAETMQRALETKPHGFLVKPINDQSLHTTIEVALRHHAAELSLQRVQHALAERNTELELKSTELTALADHLQHESVVDSLTGLYNRRQFDVALHRELTLARREGLSVGLLLLDVDRFKEVNDTFGHLTGDAVLRDVAGCLRSHLRPYDTPCRYGGDEIAIVVPGASLSETAGLAERLRLGIERLTLVTDVGLPIPSITGSFGVAGYPDQATEAEGLVRIADEGLYRAKAAGRNRVGMPLTL